MINSLISSLFSKVSFSVGFFFLLMCFLTIGVTSSKGVRAAIHNGFWFFKILLMAALLVTIFVIPISHLDQVPQMQTLTLF